MSSTLNWGILGTGQIARTLARAMPHTKSGVVVAVGSRSRERAEAFGAEWNIPRRYGSYEQVLADPGVDVVYVSTPHPEHVEWAIRAAEAGKHILCEKPIGLNFGEAMAIVEAAREHDVFLMEAFMYRCHPQTRRLVQLVRDKAIGEVRVIQATYSFRAHFDALHRLWCNALGGGGIMDVGCYPVSMSRLIAGAAVGKDFSDPIKVYGTAKLNDVTGVDEYAVGSLEFDGGIVASITTGVGVDQENVVRIYGTEGHIFVPQPWAPSTEGQPTRIYVQCTGESEPREILIDPGTWLYALEADVVADNIARRQPPPPAMTYNDTLGNMRTLERWRQAVGLTYEAERTAATVRTAHRRPLSVRAGAKMEYGPIAGVPIHVSRIGLGVDDATFPPTVAALWDDYFERGGNCFDTAYIYRGGACERALGDWVRARGVRDRVVIVEKGGHTPECEPRAVARQLRTSLDRLGIDQIDLYLLHRDNPGVPVGEFADVLDDAVKSGAVRAIGASNWTLPRVKEFNEWAARHGKPSFAVVSNQFSLAHMIEPPWPGCLSANDAEWTAWLSQTRTPLLAWSSQARGFFLDSSGPDDRTDPGRVRCWHSPDNFRRLERARELAKRNGTLPINIALAYVLRQPFPTFGLIGPRTIHETRTSLTALNIELTPDKMRWLELRGA